MRHGEPEDVLELADAPRPVPGQGQLLVRVLAAAVSCAARSCPSATRAARSWWSAMPSPARKAPRRLRPSSPSRPSTRSTRRL